MSLRDYLFHEEPGITLYCGDCREVLPLLEPVDAVITDPPYNVGLIYGDGHDDNKPIDEHIDWLARILTACGEVSRDGVVFFPGVVNEFRVHRLLPGPGLRPIRMLGWHRREFAGDLWRGGPAISWEPIIWASHAPAPYFTKTFGHWGRDFCLVDSIHGDPLKAVHPCPKPYRVMRWLVGLFVPDAGSVCDPFTGTGTTLVAAKESGRAAIGIEIEPRYCEIAVKRLRQEVLPFGAQ